ncbi:hypothetical protein Amir_6016 [Actinosynnema mirum DSM 43827]|uniref:Uncharacterized protein n=1 Tax=Actinosynnema mirum (strain ATCC 29888 / DSM 43827 / JCM 3225 / NBRC 14064 / NCIMB 13271 / NRRL B-12336 / IMRU 3971 / 101) TaxID=446462 RepID=C6WG59_ACTMD|nr:hypothetical protein Amir_6016 [Actinosynnema mirum DSM 43827]
MRVVALTVFPGNGQMRRIKPVNGRFGHPFGFPPDVRKAGPP